ATIDKALRLGGDFEQVTVSGDEHRTINQASTELSTVVTDRQVTELPLTNRNFISFVLLIPGVTSSSTDESEILQTGRINGSRQPSFLLDGSDNNNPTFAGPQTKELPFDTVQEVVISSADQAVFGGTPQGIVNVTTRS